MDAGSVAYHVLDTMVAIEEAITSGQTTQIASTVNQIALLPEGWDPYQATL